MKYKNILLVLFIILCTAVAVITIFINSNESFSDKIILIKNLSNSNIVIVILNDGTVLKGTKNQIGPSLDYNDYKKIQKLNKKDLNVIVNQITKVKSTRTTDSSNIDYGISFISSTDDVIFENAILYDTNEVKELNTLLEKFIK